MLLTIENEWFVDEKGRKTLLRGVNLGGSSKVPFKPNGATHIRTDFTNRDVSFVGRPFPLDTAVNHLRRIKHWGFNALRFIITWEAIEHTKPKQYDTEYLDYLEEVFKIIAEHKLYTLIDPHQDLWSRASGGDGAPIWTFEKVGLDVTKFNESEAAFLMQYRYNSENPDAYPPMAWIQNYGRFATCTMFTLFFGGADFAPSCKVDGHNIQDYLQNHYFNAIKQVARRVKDNPYVIGFEILNEPSPGWIDRFVDGSDRDYSQQLFYSFTPFTAMITAAGFPQKIPYKAIKRFGIREIRRDLLNPKGVSCWLDGFEDIWRREGVWGLDASNAPMILRNNYFKIHNGRPIDFIEDYLAPFAQRIAQIIREVCPAIIIGIEPPPESVMRGKQLPKKVPMNIVNASHWYDDITIALKRFRGWLNYDTKANKLVLGTGKIQQMYTQQLSTIKALSKICSGTIPTVLGEFGLCFDLNNRSAYGLWQTNPTKAWKKHVQALSMYYNAMDANLLHTMLWNYTPDNNNTLGDLWNQEDFSIFCKDQQSNSSDINSGGRAIAGFCRPYFMSVAGTPLEMSFSIKSKVFRFKFDANTRIRAPTVIYVPAYHYPDGFQVELAYWDHVDVGDHQLFAFRVLEPGIHTLVIKPLE